MLSAIKVCLLTIVIGITAIRANGEDYNKEEHGLLCNVLAAAVRKWGNNGEKVSGPLKQALQQTIFGMNENRGENPKTLTLPKEYESNGGIDPNHDRHQWCGECNGRHYPGESALHDLLCLCTLGPEGVPNETSDTLCGHNPERLGVAQPKRMGFGPSAEAVKNTWEKSVKSCLINGGGKSLKSLLETLKEKIEGNRNRLGVKGSAHPSGPLCGGNTPGSICVDYNGESQLPSSSQQVSASCINKSKWWLNLYEAIKGESPEEEIETPQKLEQQENVETPKHSESTTEDPKAKKLTATPQTTSPESGTLITRSQWPLLVVLFI